jgi:hypothetical protein
MARTVLRNLNGPERTPTELRELIKSTYGVEPAKTLDQMLYKRATAGNTFYKTADGKFGLLEFRVVTEEVFNSSTSASAAA